MTKRTQLDLWKDVFHEHNTITEFLEWLESRGFVVEPLNHKDIDLEEFPTLDSLTPIALVDKFFGVNRVALEKERRKLLDSLGKKENE